MLHACRRLQRWWHQQAQHGPAQAEVPTNAAVPQPVLQAAAAAEQVVALQVAEAAAAQAVPLEHAHVAAPAELVLQQQGAAAPGTASLRWGDVSGWGEDGYDADADGRATLATTAWLFAPPPAG